MKPKNTLILLIVAGLMFGFIWFKERHMATTEEVSAHSKRVFDLKSGDLTKLQLQLNTSNYVGRIVVEKEKDKWSMREPLAYRASASEINSICSGLEFLDRQGTITPQDMKEKGGKLADYGFDKPAGELTFWIKEKSTTVKIGKVAPVGNTVYIQLAGSNDVLMVDKKLLTDLDHKLDDFRDKSVAEFSSFQANRLEIAQGKKSIEVVKAPKPGAAASSADKVWRIAQPLNARADQGKVEGLLSKLQELKAESFASDKAGDLKGYDLDQPQLELTVCTTEQEGAVITVQFGGAVKDDAGRIYCKRKGSDTVLTIKNDILKDFTVQVNDLRDKKLTDFVADDAQQVAIKFANQTIRVAKEKEDWKLTEPEIIRAEGNEVTTLLNNLTGIEVKEFVADVVTDLAKYGLDKPYYTVAVKKEVVHESAPAPVVPAASATNSASATTGTNAVTAAKTPAAPAPAAKSEVVTLTELQFGKEEKDQKKVYVKRSDEPYIYAVDSSVLEKLPRTALALRNRSLISTEKSKVTRLSSQHGATRVAVEKKGDQWKLVADAQGVLDTAAVEDVLWALTGLSAEKFASANPADKPLFGLDNPAYVLNFEVNEGGTNKTFELSLGKETADKGRYGLLGGQPVISELSASLTTTLTKDLIKRPETNAPAASVTAPATNALPSIKLSPSK